MAADGVTAGDGSDGSGGSGDGSDDDGGDGSDDDGDSDDGGGSDDGGSDDDGGDGRVSPTAIALLLVVGLPLVVAGAHGVVVQDRQIAGARTTQGTVVSVASNFAAEGDRPADRSSPGDRFGDHGDVRPGGPARPVARSQYGGGAAVAASQDRFVFEVRYRYAVDGRTYTASSPYPLQVRETVPARVARFLGLGSTGTTVTTDDVDTAREYASRFRENSTITVYHDPQDPADSYLIEYYSLAPHSFLAVGLTLVVPGVVAALRLLARRVLGDPNAGGASPIRLVVGVGLLAAPSIHLVTAPVSLVRLASFAGLSLFMGGMFALSCYASLSPDW